MRSCGFVTAEGNDAMVIFVNRDHDSSDKK
jgi:hypothetical protein